MAQRSDPRRRAEADAAVDKRVEAQRIVDLAAADGFFDKANRKRRRRDVKAAVRAAAEELLAEAYPELRIRVEEEHNIGYLLHDGDRIVKTESWPVVPRFVVRLEIKRRFQ